MRKAVFALSFLCALLAGCDKGANDGGATRSESATAPTGAAVIHGRAFYLERIMLPPGTVLEVQLISDRRADAPEAVVAQQRFADLKGPPYDFALSYDRARVPPNASYSLKATLSGADGRAEFATDTRVPVNPASDKLVQFRLVRVPGN
jgi:putative lipoprotein